MSIDSFSEKNFPHNPPTPRPGDALVPVSKPLGLADLESELAAVERGVSPWRAGRTLSSDLQSDESNESRIAVITDGDVDLALLDQVETGLARISESYAEKWGREPFSPAVFEALSVRPRDDLGEQPSVVDAIAAELGEGGALDFEQEQRARTVAYEKTREAQLRYLEQLSRTTLHALWTKGRHARSAAYWAVEEAESAYSGFKEAGRKAQEPIFARLRGLTLEDQGRRAVALELLKRFEPLCDDEVENRIHLDLAERYELARRRAQPILDRAAVIDRAWSRRLERERDERIATLRISPPSRVCRTCLLPVADWGEPESDPDYCSKQCCRAADDLVLPAPWTKNCTWCNRWFVSEVTPLDHCSPLCVLADAVDLEEFADLLARWPEVRYLGPPPLTLAERRKLGKKLLLKVQWEMRGDQVNPRVIEPAQVPTGLARALPPGVSVPRAALMAVLPAAASTVTPGASDQDHGVDLVDRFFSILRVALADGSAHVATVNGSMPRPSPGTWGWRSDEYQTEIRPQGVRVGWVDDGDLYLEWNSSYATAQRLAQAQHEPPLPVSRDTLLDRINTAGLIRSKRKGHHTTRKMIEGERLKVLHLAVPTLFPPLREPMR